MKHLKLHKPDKLYDHRKNRPHNLLLLSNIKFSSCQYVKYRSSKNKDGIHHMVEANNSYKAA